MQNIRFGALHLPSIQPGKTGYSNTLRLGDDKTAQPGDKIYLLTEAHGKPELISAEEDHGLLHRGQPLPRRDVREKRSPSATDYAPNTMQLFGHNVLTVGPDGTSARVTETGKRGTLGFKPDTGINESLTTWTKEGDELVSETGQRLKLVG